MEITTQPISPRVSRSGVARARGDSFRITGPESDGGREYPRERRLPNLHTWLDSIYPPPGRVPAHSQAAIPLLANSHQSRAIAEPPSDGRAAGRRPG